MFRKHVPFNELNVKLVPRDSGIYIIYNELTQQPVYVGRSRCDIRARLLCHLKGRGNLKIADALARRIPLEFEYECLNSVEQVEALLIRELGSINFFNLRRETDPADWN